MCEQYHSITDVKEHDENVVKGVAILATFPCVAAAWEKLHAVVRHAAGSTVGGT